MNWITKKFYEGSHRLEKIEIFDFQVKDENGQDCTDVYLPKLLDQITYKVKNVTKNKCNEL